MSSSDQARFDSFKAATEALEQTAALLLEELFNWAPGSQRTELVSLLNGVILVQEGLSKLQEIAEPEGYNE